MWNYIARRLLLMVPTIILVTIVVFFAIRLIPGSILDQMVAQQTTGTGPPLSLDQLKHMLGLDVPVYIQYGQWFIHIFQGNLGYSLWSGYPVTTELMNRLPVSLELGAIAFIVAESIALPVGIYSAMRQDTRLDYLLRSLSIGIIAVPGFWIGTMVMVYPSVWWGWSPPMQFVPFLVNPVENLKIMIIPAIVMGMSLSGATMRMTRTMMLEVLRQDYIRTAWSKGLRERTVLFRHALKNAFIPVITLVGNQIPFFIGGAVVFEQIFALPGIGRLTLEALTSRDYTVVSGVNLLVIAIVLLSNLVVDIAYGFLDPRIKYY